MGSRYQTSCFDFRRPQGDNVFNSATVRDKEVVVSRVCSASGHRGLLIKSFDPSSKPEWIKPQHDESGPAHLARVLRLASDSSSPGVCFSNAGSAGIRRDEGAMATKVRVHRFSKNHCREDAVFSWKHSPGKTLKPSALLSGAAPCSPLSVPSHLLATPSHPGYGILSRRWRHDDLRRALAPKPKVTPFAAFGPEAIDP